MRIYCQPCEGTGLRLLHLPHPLPKEPQLSIVAKDTKWDMAKNCEKKHLNAFAIDSISNKD